MTTESGLDPISGSAMSRIRREGVGRETVDYVGNIYKYYVAYSLLADRRARLRRRAKRPKRPWAARSEADESPARMARLRGLPLRPPANRLRHAKPAMSDESGGRRSSSSAAVAVDQTYSYFAPPGLALEPGDSVQVPLARARLTASCGSARSVRGAAISRASSLATTARPVAKAARFSRLARPLDAGAARMALRLATRAAEDAGSETPRLLYRATGATPQRATPTRLRVLKAARAPRLQQESPGRSRACSSGVIDALVDEGALETIARRPRGRRTARRAVWPPSWSRAAGGGGGAHGRHSRARLSSILAGGVTGSGKTEVYFEPLRRRCKAADRRSS